MTTADRILAAAGKILDREGSEAISLRRVAKIAKLTPMAIYHHFGNRKELLEALANREILRFVEFIRAGQTWPSHASRLVHNGDPYLRYALTRPRVFDYLFSEARIGAMQYPDGFQARRSPSLNILADIVAAAMHDGYLRTADVWEVTMQLWAHNHGFAMLYLGGRFNLSEAQFFDLVHRSTRRLLYGLKK